MKDIKNKKQIEEVKNGENSTELVVTKNKKGLLLIRKILFIILLILTILLAGSIIKLVYDIHQEKSNLVEVSGIIDNIDNNEEILKIELAEKEEQERLEAEKAEQERLEAERLEAERLEKERLEAEKAEQERIEAEKKKQEQEKQNQNKVQSNGSPYYIKVNYTANVVTIYKYDENSQPTIPVKAMICSTGKETPRSGVYNTLQKYRWILLNGNVYGQYSTRIVRGILFHSVPYRSKSENSLITKYYDQLGKAVSAGCVRLTVADAKWIYDNCPVGTPVEFYSSSNPGPLGKPTSMKISGYASNLQVWDPTDPNPNNPWIAYRESQKNKEQTETNNTNKVEENKTQTNTTGSTETQTGTTGSNKTQTNTTTETNKTQSSTTTETNKTQTSTNTNESNTTQSSATGSTETQTGTEQSNNTQTNTTTETNKTQTNTTTTKTDTTVSNTTND